MACRPALCAPPPHGRAREYGVVPSHQGIALHPCVSRSTSGRRRRALETIRYVHVFPDRGLYRLASSPGPICLSVETLRVEAEIALQPAASCRSLELQNRQHMLVPTARRTCRHQKTKPRQTVVAAHGCCNAGLECSKPDPTRTSFRSDGTPRTKIQTVSSGKRFFMYYAHYCNARREGDSATCRHVVARRPSSNPGSEMNPESIRQ